MQARKPSLVCGWSEIEQKETETKSCKNFVGKEQWKNLYDNSMHKKIQSQRSPALDQINTKKMMWNFVTKKVRTPEKMQ